MELLTSHLMRYLKLYQTKIPSIIVSAFLILVMFLGLKKLGCVTYKEKSFKANICMVLLSFSIALIFNMTILGRNQEIKYRFRFQPFASWVIAFENKDVVLLLQIIMNIVLFIPLGVLLPCCLTRFEKNKKIILIVAVCSFGIELLQGITRIGMFEVDDILGNVLGAEIGYFMWYVMQIIRGWFQSE